MIRSTLKVLHAGKNYKPFVKKTRKQVREEKWRVAPKCDVCGPEFSYAGSNGFQQKKTCMTCGKVEIFKIAKASTKAPPAGTPSAPP